jgi:Rrf2 family protein
MLSQTVEYALRAMVHIASLEPGSTISSEAIAERANIPHGYLSKVMRGLAVAELVRSQRGPKGGFSLARPADSISLLDVVNAVDPIARIRKCPLGNPAHLRLCPLHRRIDDAIGMIEQEFRRTTLAELMAAEPEDAPSCRRLMPMDKPKA